MIRRWLLSGILIAGAAAQTYSPEAIRQANVGVALAGKSDFAGAVRAYQRALTLDPRVPHLYLNLGLAYFKQGHFREALAAFKKEPSNDRVITLTGMSHFGLGEYKLAAAVLRPLQVTQPDNAELGYLLAKCYLWAGEYDQAMEMFRSLLVRDPNSAPVHMLLAEALDADDREHEATAEFEEAVKAGAQQPEVHFGLGYLYWKQRRYEDAEREFRAELKNNPEHALSLAYLGDLLLRNGDKHEALTLLRQADSYDASLHVVHQDLGIYYQEENQLTLAVTEFQAAVRTAPENYDAHYRLARIYKQMSRLTEAEKEFAIVRRLHQQKQEEPLMRISGPR